MGVSLKGIVGEHNLELMRFSLLDGSFTKWVSLVDMKKNVNFVVNTSLFLIIVRLWWVLDDMGVILKAGLRILMNISGNSSLICSLNFKENVNCIFDLKLDGF